MAGMQYSPLGQKIFACKKLFQKNAKFGLASTLFAPVPSGKMCKKYMTILKLL